MTHIIKVLACVFPCNFPKNFIRGLASFWPLLALGACLGMPSTVVPVQGFSVDRYLGKWYEIARLDHSFERGLEQVTANYSLNEDGSIKVTNRGFLPPRDDKQGIWKEANGKAKFVEDPNQGYLKVSFFGPFYGSYIVFGLDEQNYDYAFVSGPDFSYLWLLSRNKQVSDKLRSRFITKAKELGFDTDELIFVKH